MRQTIILINIRIFSVVMTSQTTLLGIMIFCLLSFGMIRCCSFSDVSLQCPVQRKKAEREIVKNHDLVDVKGENNQGSNVFPKLKK